MKGIDNKYLSQSNLYNNKLKNPEQIKFREEACKIDLDVDKELKVDFNYLDNLYKASQKKKDFIDEDYYINKYKVFKAEKELIAVETDPKVLADIFAKVKNIYSTDK